MIVHREVLSQKKKNDQQVKKVIDMEDVDIIRTHRQKSFEAFWSACEQGNRISRGWGRLG